MLCCVGLFGGLAVGQMLGGPWTIIAPAAGFGIGFLADMKLMKGLHKKADHPDTGLRAPGDPNPVRDMEVMEVVESEVRHPVEPLAKT